MRVVLADDSVLSRLPVESTLTKAGHDVTSVGDGEEAVAAFARVSPTPALQHEINNPLAALLVQAQLLAMDAEGRS